MPDFIIDAGNSRIKLTRCQNAEIILPVAATSDRTPAGLKALCATLQVDFAKQHFWAIGSSNPPLAQDLQQFLLSHNQQVLWLDSRAKIPLLVDVDYPDQVGIDRLLNAVAAKSLSQNTPRIIVDAGSAVTVDFVDETSIFRGGVIFPGMRLMGQALKANTAKLPLIEPAMLEKWPVPARNTQTAIGSGIAYAIAGGIDRVVEQLASLYPTPPHVLLTGGDISPRLIQLLQITHRFQLRSFPALTLQGIATAATTFSGEYQKTS
ncbi:MAG: type III pantothenate kinase [Zavarzinella sp.]